MSTNDNAFSTFFEINFGIVRIIAIDKTGFGIDAHSTWKLQCAMKSKMGQAIFLLASRPAGGRRHFSLPICFSERAADCSNTRER